MKQNLIANAFTNIDDRYINESHPAAVLAAKGKLSRAEGPIRRFLNSGWGAAVLSAACALLVLTGIIWAGRMGVGGPSSGSGTQPLETENAGILVPDKSLSAGAFSFSYRIDAPEGFRRGATITIRTEMTNITEEPVRASGSSSDREAHIRLTTVVDSVFGTTVDIAPTLCYTTNVVPHTYAPGETVNGELTFQIPGDAPYGTYALVLSYPYNPEWTVTFENVFTLKEPQLAPDTPALTLTLDGVEYPLRGGHLFSGTLLRDNGDGTMEGVEMDGMPPSTLAEMERMDCGSLVRYTKGSVFSRMKLEAIRMEEGTAVWEEIKVYDATGKCVREGTDSIKGGLSDDAYYAVLTLKVGGFPYTMGDKTYTVENGIIAVVFRLVSPDFIEETAPETAPPVILPETEPETTPADDVPTEALFVYNYSVDAPDGFARGKSFTITPEMIYTADVPLTVNDISSTDVLPRICIRCKQEGGTYDRLDEILDSTDDIISHTYKPGERVRGITRTIRIPDDAPAGEYVLKIDCTADVGDGLRETIFVLQDADEEAGITEIETVSSLKEYFFSEINRGGSLLGDDEPYSPPTGLVEPDRVPQEDRQDVLYRQYAIRLTPELSAGYNTYESGLGYLHWQESSDTAEQLLVYLGSDHIDLVLRFAVCFGSTEAFRRAVANGEYFTAILLECTNVEYLGVDPYVCFDESKAGELSLPLGEPYTSEVAVSAGYTNHRDRESNADAEPALSFGIMDTADTNFLQYIDRLKLFRINFSFPDE